MTTDGKSSIVLPIILIFVTVRWGVAMSSLANSLIFLKGRFASLGLAAALACFLGLGFVATTLDSALAQGQPVILTPVQVAAIQAQVTAAINAANMQQFNNMVVDPAALIVCNCTRPNVDQANTMQCDNPARTAALAQAITNVTLNLIGQFGPSAAGDVTSIIIATSMAAGVPPSAIGTGLGRAAQQIGVGNGPAAISDRSGLGERRNSRYRQLLLACRSDPCRGCNGSANYGWSRASAATGSADRSSANCASACHQRQLRIA